MLRQMGFLSQTDAHVLLETRLVSKLLFYYLHSTSGNRNYNESVTGNISDSICSVMTSSSVELAACKKGERSLRSRSHVLMLVATVSLLEKIS